MRISDLIRELEQIRLTYGDLRVVQRKYDPNVPNSVEYPSWPSPRYLFAAQPERLWGPSDSEDTRGERVCCLGRQG